MTTKTLAVVSRPVLLAGLPASGPVLAQSSGPTNSAVNAYLDSMPADLRADKAQRISDAIAFNDKEAAAFWPVYKLYEADEAKLDDERMQLVKSYADPWSTFTDAEARDLVQKSLALESRRADLKTKYFDRFNQVLPGLEHRLDLLVDLKIASEPTVGCNTQWGPSARAEITSCPGMSGLPSVLTCVFSFSSYCRL